MTRRPLLELLSHSMHADGALVTDDELLLRLVAGFSISCEGLPIYSEPEFPVVELASALATWARNPEAVRADFNFESMEASEPDLLWIKQSADGWRVGAARQVQRMVTAVSFGEVDFAVRRYVRDVASQAKALGFDVTRIVQ